MICDSIQENAYSQQCDLPTFRSTHRHPALIMPLSLSLTFTTRLSGGQHEHALVHLTECLYVFCLIICMTEEL